MTDRHAFLAAIKANPDDDTPRLVFADWLDEHGGSDSDRARAEFIRLQCAVSATGHYGWEPFNRTPWSRCPPRCDTCAKIEGPVCRFMMILSEWGAEWSGVEALAVPGTVVWDGSRCNVLPLIAGGKNGWLTFDRGFADYAAMPAADWIAHAETLLAREPIGHVLLQTEPEYQANGRAGGRREYWLDGRDGSRWSATGHHVSDPARRWAVERFERNATARALVRAEWPGIMFDYYA